MLKSKLHQTNDQYITLNDYKQKSSKYNNKKSGNVQQLSQSDLIVDNCNVYVQFIKIFKYLSTCFCYQDIKNAQW